MPLNELQLSPVCTNQSDIRDDAKRDALLLGRYFKYGDREAMDELFKRHADTAYRLAFADLGNAADAEEAVQTAFFKVLLNEVNQTDNVRGWIMRIVVNTCHDKRKEETRRREREEVAALNRTADAEREDEKSELVTAAIGAVKALPKKYRLPVWLHHLEGLSFKEVGCALSLPDETVRKQASLGIEQVRQALTAAGFTANALVIPDLLASSTLPPASASLMASFNSMIAHATAKGSGVATGAASSVAKDVVVASTNAVSSNQPSSENPKPGTAKGFRILITSGIVIALSLAALTLAIPHAPYTNTKPVSSSNPTQPTGANEDYIPPVARNLLDLDQHVVIGGRSIVSSHERAVVRLRYKAFNSVNYMSKVTEPSQEKMIEFYDRNKNEPGMKGLFFTEPRMSADFLYYDSQMLLQDLKATADELKDYYECNKKTNWKKQRDPKEPLPPPGKEEYKPYDEVKDDVERKWIEYAKRTRPIDEFQKLTADLQKEETAWNAEEAKKPNAADRKPFDIAEFAKKHNLKHWVTNELAEAEYDSAREKYQDKEKQPEKEIGGVDSHWVSGLFHMGEMLSDSKFTDPKYVSFMDNIKRQYEKFAYPEQVDPSKQDKGLVSYRKKAFIKGQLMTLDQAKPAIIERLLINDAKELAKKEADRLEANWKAGKNVPVLDTLEEIVTDSETAATAGPLVTEFFRPTRPVSKVLMASGPAYQKNSRIRNPHEIYYVGIVVEP